MILELENAYKNQTEMSRLTALGQFFTPFEVAVFMCQWVMHESKTQKIYDPAFGLGSFYFAAKSLSENIKFSGTEIDNKIYNFFNQNFLNRDSITIDCNSYFKNWRQKHTAIVCNPPYMRFQKFKDRKKVFSEFEKNLNIKLIGYTNIASAFLIKSLSELKKNGRLAYIMPLEFLNTGYGTLVKQTLLKSNKLKALIQIIPEKEVFPEVTTSIGIILVHNTNKDDRVKFYSISNTKKLKTVLTTKPNYSIQSSKLDPKIKWMSFFKKDTFKVNQKNLLPLSYYGSFTRGIATGANSFFTLSPRRYKELGLPRSALKYCITKSSHIKSSILNTEDIQQMKKSNLNIFILDACNKMDDKKVRAYILHGEKKGFHLRYLTRKRTPWYRIENRNPAPILFGVFSRNTFKIIRNYSSALNLTCYHGFYPNIFGNSFIDMLFLYFHSKTCFMILQQNARIYGDNLQKFEPNDLNKIFVPHPNWFSQRTDKYWSDEMNFFKQSGCLSNKTESLFNSLICRT